MCVAGADRRSLVNGNFSDVCAYGSRFFAACCSDSSLHVFNATTLLRERVLDLPCSRSSAKLLHSVIANRQHVTVLCVEDDVMLTLTHAGDVTSRECAEGVTRLCQCDDDGVLLVTDGQGRLQVRDKCKQGHVLSLKPPVLDPVAAVYDDGALFVCFVETNGEAKLAKYEIL